MLSVESREMGKLWQKCLEYAEISCFPASSLDFAASTSRREVVVQLGGVAGGGGGEEKKVLEFERRGNIVRVCYSKL
jgi:hypothetical protein